MFEYVASGIMEWLKEVCFLWLWQGITDCWPLPSDMSFQCHMIFSNALITVVDCIWLQFVSGLPSAHQMNPNDTNLSNLAGYPNRNAQVLQAMSTIWDRDRAFSNSDIWGALFLNANLILVGTLLYYMLHFYNSTLQRCFNSYSYPDVILSTLCVVYSSCDSAWRSAICSERLESLPLKWTNVFQPDSFVQTSRCMYSTTYTFFFAPVHASNTYNNMTGHPNHPNQPRTRLCHPIKLSWCMQLWKIKVCLAL